MVPVESTQGKEPHNKEKQDARERLLTSWFEDHIPTQHSDASSQDYTLAVVSGDASFRRYFRVSFPEVSYILMDAPPEKEDSSPFVAIAKLWKTQGVNVPEIFSTDLTQGFICLGDFGSRQYWQQLKEQGECADELYKVAINELLKIQKVKQELPDYDEGLLLIELTLFQEWFCEGLLDIDVSSEEQELINTSFNFLIQSALRQPQVCVHRDYHSRNLMICADGSVGVLDFQDAVIGPVTYDLVSLLKDCYLEWPREQVLHWVSFYKSLATDSGILAKQDEAGFIDEKSFVRDFDLMGIQRHLKVLGIFSRLSLRDGKNGYLQDIPLTFRYIENLAGLYPELNDFHHWLASRVKPVMISKLEMLSGKKA